MIQDLFREMTCWEESKQIFQEFQDKQLYKRGLMVNSVFWWLGASPDGIIYDFEKSLWGFWSLTPFCGVGKNN